MPESSGDTRRDRDSYLKPKSTVGVTTMGAHRLGRLASCRIDLITPNAVKNRAPTLSLEARMIAAIVVDPQSKEERSHQQAIDDGSGGQIEHGNVLPKRFTGLAQDVGEMLRERDDVYAVARSVPARWLEQYFLVEWPANREVFAAKWTDEEKSTIQQWKWWSLDELLDKDPSLFKPGWIPDLLGSVLHRQHLSHGSP